VRGRGDRRAAVWGRVCGIDIGKAQMAVTSRVPLDKDPSRRMAETRMFGTAKREVLALADWLRA
jgi:transposase